MSPPPKVNGRAYRLRHEGTLVVLGSADCALDDLAAVKQERPDALIASVGFAVRLCRSRFVFSDHYEIHKALRAARAPFGGAWTQHCCDSPGRRSLFPDVDYWWPWRRPRSTSAFSAIRFGVCVGFDEIILCGCPLTFGRIQDSEQRERDGEQWPPPRKSFTQPQKKFPDSTRETVLRDFREHFVRDCLELSGKVRSMSGYTRDVLGAPEWIGGAVCQS